MFTSARNEAKTPSLALVQKSSQINARSSGEDWAIYELLWALVWLVSSQ